MSAVWDSLVQNSTDLVTTAAGTALDKYTNKLINGSDKPVPTAAPAKTVGDSASSKKWIIGGVIAVVIGALAWFVLRKK